MKLYNIEILFKYYMYVANDEIKKIYASASWKVNDKSLDDKFDSKKVTVQSDRLNITRAAKQWFECAPASYTAIEIQNIKA